MYLFSRIRDSIYSPKFYSKIRDKSLGRTLLYYLVLSFLLTIIHVFLIAPPLIPEGNKVVKFVKEMPNFFPSDLEIKIKNGNASVNVEEPYFIPIRGEEIVENKSNYLVIDTKTPFSIKQMSDYSAIAWLSRDTVFIQSSRGDVRAYNLSRLGDITIDRNFVEDIIGKLLPLTSFIPAALLIAVFFGLFLLYLLRLIYMLFVALLIMILSKLMKWKFSYGQSYKIGLYAITAGLLIEVVLAILDKFTRTPDLPFATTIITLVIVFINYRQLPKKSFVSPKK